VKPVETKTLAVLVHDKLLTRKITVRRQMKEWREYCIDAAAYRRRPTGEDQKLGRSVLHLVIKSARDIFPKPMDNLICEGRDESIFLHVSQFGAEQLICTSKL
jgi:hypothetical protein